MRMTNTRCTERITEVKANRLRPIFHGSREPAVLTHHEPRQTSQVHNVIPPRALLITLIFSLALGFSSIAHAANMLSISAEARAQFRAQNTCDPLLRGPSKAEDLKVGDVIENCEVLRQLDDNPDSKQWIVMSQRQEDGLIFLHVRSVGIKKLLQAQFKPLMLGRADEGFQFTLAEGSEDRFPRVGRALVSSWSKN